jgi:formate dehydrogenase subunit delta
MSLDQQISTNNRERLVHMANQIARFFASQPKEDAAASVAAHLKSFWDPRMREMIVAHLAAGGEGLDPVARDAVSRLSH